MTESAKKAPSKMPKKDSSVTLDVAKQAPSDLPKKQGWELIFSIFALLLWVGAAVIVSQLIVGYLMLWILGRETFAEPVPTAVFSALSYILAMVLIIFVPPKISVKWKIVKEKESGTKVKAGKKAPKAVSRNELGLRGLPTWTDVGLAPVGYIVYLFLAAGVTLWFSSFFPWFDMSQAQDVGFNTYISGVDRLIAFLILVVVAPVAEEIIFRGWLYGKLRAKLSRETTNTVSMIVSAILVSLLFGIIHLQWNVGVNVFAMSLVLCGLREITGTIYAGILLHMLKNGIAFYLLYVVGIS